MKRTIKILIAVVLSVVVVVVAFNIATKTLYAIDIGIPTPMNRDGNYLLSPVISMGGFVSPSQEEMLKKYSDTNNKFLLDFHDKYEGMQYKIECEVKVETDKTILKYYGPITDPKTNKTTDFSKEIVFDFVFAKNLVGQTIK